MNPALNRSTVPHPHSLTVRRHGQPDELADHLGPMRLSKLAQHFFLRVGALVLAASGRAIAAIAWPWHTAAGCTFMSGVDCFERIALLAHA